MRVSSQTEREWLGQHECKQQRRSTTTFLTSTFIFAHCIFWLSSPMPLTRLKQVVGAPQNHDLGSAGADAVTLQSEGLKTLI